MWSERDEALIGAARELGFLTPEQARDSKASFETVSQAGAKISLERLLLDKKFLSREQLKRVVAALHSRGFHPTIGQYDILEKLGEGGTATVYKARDTRTGRLVALKVLNRAMAADGVTAERFLRGALLAARVQHPNIVHVLESGQDGRNYFLAMEYVEGTILSEKAALGAPLPEREALDIAKQVATGLAACHAQGVVHRDVKPSNVIVTAAGLAKLTDLGIARGIEPGADDVTLSGYVVGTPHYMSPEQCAASKDVDARSDIYSLGATLYFMLTGQPPFHGTTIVDVMKQQSSSQLPNPRQLNPAVSDLAHSLLWTMMSKTPSGRPQTAEAVIASIERVQRMLPDGDRVEDEMKELLAQIAKPEQREKLGRSILRRVEAIDKRLAALKKFTWSWEGFAASVKKARKGGAFAAAEEDAFAGLAGRISADYMRVLPLLERPDRGGPVIKHCGQRLSLSATAQQRQSLAALEKGCEAGSKLLRDFQTFLEQSRRRTISESFLRYNMAKYVGTPQRQIAAAVFGLAIVGFLAGYILIAQLSSGKAGVADHQAVATAPTTGTKPPPTSAPPQAPPPAATAEKPAAAPTVAQQSVPVVPAAAPPKSMLATTDYVFTVIGNDLEPAGLNNRGQVAGALHLGGQTRHAFLWSEGEGIKDLGTLPPPANDSSRATAINDAGEVAGWCGGPQKSDERPFVWTPLRGMQRIPDLGGTQAPPLAINASGQIVGWSSRPDRKWRAFLYTPGKGTQELGTLIGAVESQASAINAQGWVVGGSSTNRPLKGMPVIWIPGEPIKDLGLFPEAEGGWPYGINDAGDVVGSMSVYDHPSPNNYVLAYSRPFIWTAAKGLSALPMPNYDSAKALKINNRGQILLSACNGRLPNFKDAVSFILDNGHFSKLPEFPNGTKTQYIALNDNGQLLGTATLKATDSNAEVRVSFLATPKSLATVASSSKKLTLDCGNNVTMELTLIPAGEFMMGSPANEAAREASEGPQRRVKITKPFFMGIYTVTQAQFEAVLGVNPSKFLGQDNPVEVVAWDAAAQFCRILSAKTGQAVRLPTEAEWEYACRAGTTTPFNTGETISTAQANFNGLHPYGNAPVEEFRSKTMPVGSFAANAFGLYDMHGNEWEWCQDWYGSYAASDAVDPQGPATGQTRVLRGGSWFNSPMYCRSASRHTRERPDQYNGSVGFRVVCVAKALSPQPSQEALGSDKPHFSGRFDPDTTEAPGPEVLDGCKQLDANPPAYMTDHYIVQAPPEEICKAVAWTRSVEENIYPTIIEILGYKPAFGSLTVVFRPEIKAESMLVGVRNYGREATLPATLTLNTYMLKAMPPYRMKGGIASGTVMAILEEAEDNADWKPILEPGTLQSLFEMELFQRLHMGQDLETISKFNLRKTGSRTAVLTEFWKQYGWQPFQKLLIKQHENPDINAKLDEPTFVYEMSLGAGKDVSPFFESRGWNVPAETKARIAQQLSLK